MVKAGDRLEPLLRRPFSVFEMLADDGDVVGLSLLSKRIGPSTTLLFDAKPGDRIQCLGPLGRPFALVAPPDEAWLVAGGVGLAPFATLAEALLRADTSRRGSTTAHDVRPSCSTSTFFDKMGVELVLTTEDGSRGDRGRVTLPLERDLEGAVRRRERDALCVRTGADARGCRQAGSRLRSAVAGFG